MEWWSGGVGGCPGPFPVEMLVKVLDVFADRSATITIGDVPVDRVGRSNRLSGNPLHFERLRLKQPTGVDVQRDRIFPNPQLLIAAIPILFLHHSIPPLLHSSISPLLHHSTPSRFPKWPAPVSNYRISTTFKPSRSPRSDWRWSLVINSLASNKHAAATCRRSRVRVPSWREYAADNRNAPSNTGAHASCARKKAPASTSARRAASVAATAASVPSPRKTLS